MSTVISTIIFLVSLLISYFAANMILTAANEKYNILKSLQSYFQNVKYKKALNRYYLLAAFVIYIVVSEMLDLNALGCGILLGLWSSFVMLVYTPASVKK